MVKRQKKVFAKFFTGSAKHGVSHHSRTTSPRFSLFVDSFLGVVLVFSMPPSALPILILWSTAPSGRRAVRVAYGPGLLDRASSSGSNFTFSFSFYFFMCSIFVFNFFMFYFLSSTFFLPFFTFLPEFLCEKVFSKFSIS